MNFPYRFKDNDNCLDYLISACCGNLGIRGILLAIRAPHGYEMQFEVVQDSDGSLRWRRWNDFSESNAPYGLYPHPTNLDFVDELRILREQNSKLRVQLPWQEGRGRYGTLFLAAAGGGEWLTCQPPIYGEPTSNLSIDRLWGVIFPKQPNDETR